MNSIKFQTFSDQPLSPSQFLSGWSKSEFKNFIAWENLSFEPSPEYLAILQDIPPNKKTPSFTEKKKKVFTIIRNATQIQREKRTAAVSYEAEIPQIKPSKRQYDILEKAHKQEILNFLGLNGASKTIEAYGEKFPSLTKKKLNSWQKSANKFQASPGKRSHDPKRDVEILDWIKEFEVNMKRNPNRREIKEIAFEKSNDPSFKASKGWLDKFCKKHQINLMPMKGVCPVKKEEEISTVEFSTLQGSMDDTESFVLENGNSSENNYLSFIDYSDGLSNGKGDLDEIPFFRKYCKW